MHIFRKEFAVFGLAGVFQHFITMTGTKQIRKTVNSVFFWLLVYNVLQLALVLTGIFKNSPEGLDMLVVTLVGVALVYLVNIKKIDGNPFAVRKKMNARDFFTLFGIISITQLLTLLIINTAKSSGAEGISIDQSKNTLAMIIYAGFTGPFCEEMMFRGFAAGRLRKFGNIFAIVISSVAFGLMHGNLEQFVAACFAGMVLAFVFCEYSLIWALVYHIINNFVFGTLPELIFPNASSKITDTVSYSIFGVFAVYAIIQLIKRRGEISAWFKREDNVPQKGSFAGALTSIWFWVFVLIYVGVIVGMMLFPEAVSFIMSQGG